MLLTHNLRFILPGVHIVNSEKFRNHVLPFYEYIHVLIIEITCTKSCPLWLLTKRCYLTILRQRDRNQNAL